LQRRADLRQHLLRPFQDIIGFEQHYLETQGSEKLQPCAEPFGGHGFAAMQLHDQRALTANMLDDEWTYRRMPDESMWMKRRRLEQSR
jgi:hypothetical protein